MEGWKDRSRGNRAQECSSLTFFFSTRMVSPSQIVAPFSTITQGEVKDVTPGQAGIRTHQVLALASVPASARVGSCLAKPCILEQAPWRDSARRQLHLN